MRIAILAAACLALVCYGCTPKQAAAPKSSATPKSAATVVATDRTTADEQAAHEAAKKRCPAYPDFDMGEPGKDVTITFTKYETFLASKKCSGCHAQGGKLLAPAQPAD